ncbi:MAG: hypothetical protein ACLQPD_28350 [Desulfomonilaceae bacterium]
MGEIRSTIDLMMERTKGMTLSVEEQDRLKREKLGKQAKGYRMKLLEFPEGAEQILETIMEEPAEDRELLRHLIWIEMVENLPADGEILKYLELMERLPQAGSKRSIMDELRGAFKTGLKHQVPDRKKMVQREKKKLATLGISGSAVIPKIPQNPPPDLEFISILQRCKKELLNLQPV